MTNQARWSLFRAARVGSAHGDLHGSRDRGLHETMTVVVVGIGTRLSIGTSSSRSRLLDARCATTRATSRTARSCARVDTEFQGLVIGGAVVF